jgi:hypothetical protein
MVDCARQIAGHVKEIINFLEEGAPLNIHKVVENPHAILMCYVKSSTPYSPRALKRGHAFCSFTVAAFAPVELFDTNQVVLPVYVLTYVDVLDVKMVHFFTSLQKLKKHITDYCHH